LLLQLDVVDRAADFAVAKAAHDQFRQLEMTHLHYGFVAQNANQYQTLLRQSRSFNYWDDTGFTADGEFRDGVLYHGGYIFYRER
jgi:hypothetical protein